MQTVDKPNSLSGTTRYTCEFRNGSKYRDSTFATLTYWKLILRMQISKSIYLSQFKFKAYRLMSCLHICSKKTPTTNVMYILGTAKKILRISISICKRKSSI